ncbi:MAG: response regulator [Thaumarchaeota archaeon]|nr:response regulator [Nitrososphaerota archaeon]
MEKDHEKFDLACTYMRSGQNVSAYNLLVDLAKMEIKDDNIRAGVYLILASECKSRQGKDPKDEYEMAGKYFLQVAKTNRGQAGTAYRCASKCFLKAGNVESAMKASDEAKRSITRKAEVKRPIVIVDDSDAILIRLRSYLEKLGYHDIHSANNGKAAISLVTKLIGDSQEPTVLLDMQMPDMSGDSVARKLLEKKPDLSIILVTAEGKSEPRVRNTIGLGSAAFIQKPFTINELKNALDTTEQNRIS